MVGRCKYLYEETKTYCQSRPHYGYLNDKTTSYCAKHKLDNMVLLTNKLCEDCDSQASFNYEGLNPKYCELH